MLQTFTTIEMATTTRIATRIAGITIKKVYVLAGVSSVVTLSVETSSSKTVTLTTFKGFSAMGELSSAGIVVVEVSGD